MKIGILTFQNAHNWGASLQAFALKTYLEKQGYEVKIINYINEEIQKNYKRVEKIDFKFCGFISILKYIYHKIQNLYSAKQTAEKWDKFNEFISRYLLDGSNKVYQKQDIQDAHFDIIICGSDQIWNPNLTNGLDDIYFGGRNKKAKKIAYAASMGIKKLEEQEEIIFKQYLNNFDAISVREEELEKYIKEITNKDVITVLDPTLLLEEKDYIKIEKTQKQKKYLLLYEISENANMMKISKKIAKEKKLEIVNLKYKKDIKKIFHKQLANIGPSEFIGLFHQADFVVTNSFHGTVFSILFEKEFYTIPINKVNSRIENLLNICKLQNRCINTQYEINLKEYVDFKAVKDRIQQNQEVSREFLRRGIEGEE